MGLALLVLVAEVGSGFVGEISGEKNDSFLGRIGADFFESLKGADVDAAWSLGEKVGGFGDGSSGGFFAFGGDDGGAAFTLGFSLFRHSTFHVGGELDVLETDAFDVNAPFVGLGVDDFADLSGDFVTFAEDFVEIEVTGDVAEGSLGKGAGCVAVVRGFEDGFLGVDDAGIDDGVNIDSDVVAGDDFLFRDIHRGGADVNFEHFVDVGDDDTEAGVQSARIAAEAEDDAAFVLINNADAGDND